MAFFLESIGQKEFQIPLADRADQVLPLIVPFFCFNSLRIINFFNPLPFCRQLFFVMIFIEVFAL